MKKTFSNGFGSMDLTRAEYIEHWLQSTHHYVTLFYGNSTEDAGKLIDFQCALEEVAGKYWDKHKSTKDVNEVSM